jgi:hypothetical protein
LDCPFFIAPLVFAIVFIIKENFNKYTKYIVKEERLQEMK